MQCAFVILNLTKPSVIAEGLRDASCCLKIFPKSKYQTAPRSVQPIFAQLMTESGYTLQRAAPFPLKIAPSLDWQKCRLGCGPKEQTGATCWTPLHHPCAAVTRPFVKLLWPLVANATGKYNRYNFILVFYAHFISVWYGLSDIITASFAKSLTFYTYSFHLAPDEEDPYRVT